MPFHGFSSLAGPEARLGPYLDLSSSCPSSSPVVLPMRERGRLPRRGRRGILPGQAPAEHGAQLRAAPGKSRVRRSRTWRPRTRGSSACPALGRHDCGGRPSGGRAEQLVIVEPYSGVFRDGVHAAVEPRVTHDVGPDPGETQLTECSCIPAPVPGYPCIP